MIRGRTCISNSPGAPNQRFFLSDPLKRYFKLSGVLGREKGNRARGEKEKVAPAVRPWFISSFSFAGERKIAIGSFLITRQSLPDTTF